MQSVHDLDGLEAGSGTDPRPVDLHLVGAGVGERELLERALLDVGARLKVRAHADLRALIRALSGSTDRAAMVVLDAGPRSTGAAEALAVLRTSTVSAVLPVVVVAGSDDADAIVALYRAGASVVVRRSRFVDVWLRALREVVRFWAGTAVLPTLGVEAATADS